MTIGAMIDDVSAALNRAHGLFRGGPGDVPAAGSGLTSAMALTDASRARVSTLSGRLPARIAALADTASSKLGALVDTDERFTGAVRDADAVRRTGRADSGRIVAAGVGDVARMSPLTRTPAGQRVLLTALRDRVSEQQRVVVDYEIRAARMASLLRSLSYGGAARLATAGHGVPGIFSEPLSVTPSSRTPSAGITLANSVTAGTGTPPGGLTARSSPRQCAAVLIDQARRRGYAPNRIVAILSTMLQESGGQPGAVSPNGLWQGLFQQDAGYPGRADPNLAIAGFLNRLSAKGGEDAPDIWKAIFWLQQAPGAESAEAAYANGRRAYLREITSQVGRATALYREVTGG